MNSKIIINIFLLIIFSILMYFSSMYFSVVRTIESTIPCRTFIPYNVLKEPELNSSKLQSFKFISLIQHFI